MGRRRVDGRETEDGKQRTEVRKTEDPDYERHEKHEKILYCPLSCLFVFFVVKGFVHANNVKLKFPGKNGRTGELFSGQRDSGMRAIIVVVAAFFVCLVSHAGASVLEVPKALDFVLGTDVSAEQCGICHVSIYREYRMGFGSDLVYKGMVYQSREDKLLTLPAQASTTGAVHSLAGIDPFPVHARELERGGEACNECHFPKSFEIPNLENIDLGKPEARSKEQEMGGVTCVACHLTPEGKIRGPYEVKAPHPTIADSRIKTSAMCAYCHSMGERVAGKQTQTFLEWRDEFYKPGLGLQHCQDCHMPRSLRRLADNLDVPVRTAARHLWTGGHSRQRVWSAASLVIVQPLAESAELEIHVINCGAGHAVPTGSNRRALYLIADASNEQGVRVASQDWMFSPWYGDRPDDWKYLEEDKTRPDAVAASQADAQGPHEAVLRPGEGRIMRWTPGLKAGSYTVRAKLVYDLNHFNELGFEEDQTTVNEASLKLQVK